MDIDIFLHAIAIMLFVLTIDHSLRAGRENSFKYWGLFLCLFILTICHVIYLNYPHQNRLNFLLLLPFNLIFLSFFLILRYAEALVNTAIFSPAFRRTILLMAITEIFLHFLPLGAWMYASEYERKMLDMLYAIKRILGMLLLVTSVYVFIRIIQFIRAAPLPDLNARLRTKWLRNFSFILLASACLLQTSNAVYFLSEERARWMFTLEYVLIAPLILYVSLFNSLVISKTSAPQWSGEKPEPDTLTHFNKINHYIQGEQLYLNPNLRIKDLADVVGLSSGYVSKIINENAGMGFNDFVNTFRVNAVIEKINRQEYLTKNITTLAEEAGFRSKSTFHTAFKKITGKTPKEYKTQH